MSKTDNGQVPGIQFLAGIKVEPDCCSGSSTNITIENSIAYNNGLNQTVPFTGSGIWVDTIGDGAVIRNNTVYNNNDMGINVDASNYATITGNTSYANLIGGIGAYGDGATSMTGHQILNNTTYGNTGFGILLEGPSSGSTSGGCMNNTVQGNTSTGNTTQNFQAFFGCENPGADGSGNVITYDNFGTESSDFIEWGYNTFYSTYASWETAPGNCGSVGCSHSGP